ncbi:MAG: protein-glutamate O-methyltransferase CheR [Desulfobulbaceae bacterium]|nr:protein-glutamate O-methyltransferase CheR [Desulfobulbaceae bacterium]
MVFGSAKLTDAQFEKFSALIYAKCGIHLKAEKMELLNARLGKRLRATGIDSFKAYYDFVTNDSTGVELVQLIDSVSTNFTSFFRESAHFDFMTSTVLPAYFAEGRGRGQPLTLWSAACSSGEEPYTLAMVMEEFVAGHPGMQYRIKATDISTKVLSQAHGGVYPEDRVSKVPPPFLKRYFQKGIGKSAGQVRVKEELRRKVLFERFNLMDDLPCQESLDIIFCRNVMIYFNASTQQTLVDKFFRCLAPGGHLFIGHSESLTSIKHNFKQVASTAYRK